MSGTTHRCGEVIPRILFREAPRRAGPGDPAGAETPTPPSPWSTAPRQRPEIVPRTMVRFTRRARARIVRRGSGRGATWTGNRRARMIGPVLPCSRGFGKPRVFNGLQRLAADRGAIFGVFSARFGPFLSGIVRDSPAKSGIVRDRPEWLEAGPRRLPSALPSLGRGKGRSARSTASRMRSPWGRSQGNRIWKFCGGSPSSLSPGRGAGARRLPSSPLQGGGREGGPAPGSAGVPPASREARTRMRTFGPPCRRDAGAPRRFTDERDREDPRPGCGAGSTPLPTSPLPGGRGEDGVSSAIVPYRARRGFDRGGGGVYSLRRPGSGR